MPYYMEWMPMRANDGDAFLQWLLDIAGPRAVEEFITAIATTRGEGPARSPREWWATKHTSARGT